MLAVHLHCSLSYVVAVSGCFWPTQAPIMMLNGADRFVFSLCVNCYADTISVVDHCCMSFTAKLMQTYGLKLVLGSAEAEVCSFG